MLPFFIPVRYVPTPKSIIFTDSKFVDRVKTKFSGFKSVEIYFSDLCFIGTFHLTCVNYVMLFHDRERFQYLPSDGLDFGSR